MLSLVPTVTESRIVQTERALPSLKEPRVLEIVIQIK